MEDQAAVTQIPRRWSLGRWLGNTLLAGLVAILPLFLTVWALTLLFRETQPLAGACGRYGQ